MANESDTELNELDLGTTICSGKTSPDHCPLNSREYHIVPSTSTPLSECSPADTCRCTILVKYLLVLSLYYHLMNIVFSILNAL